MLFLEPHEVEALADAIDPRYKTLVYTAAYTGLRAGELLALQRQDVDLLRGVIHVRRSLKEVHGSHLPEEHKGLILGPTKTHAQRTVALPKFLKTMLNDHLADPDALASGAGPDALVFASPSGQPLRHNLFYKRHFKPAVKKALPHKAGLRFHDLRHTCASLLAAQGAHPKLVQERLGHSSIAITLDRYSHLFPSAEEALVDALDASYAAATSPATNVAELRS